MLKAIWQTEGMSESVPSISNLTIPSLSGIPVIGALFKDQSPYLYAMFLIVAAVWIVFYKTKFGLRYRAIGDQPYAVQTAGVQVNRYRYIAMIAAGSIAGLAGSYLSISQNNLFVADMTAGTPPAGAVRHGRTGSGQHHRSNHPQSTPSTAPPSGGSFVMRYLNRPDSWLHSDGLRSKSSPSPSPGAAWFTAYV